MTARCSPRRAPRAAKTASSQTMDTEKKVGRTIKAEEGVAAMPGPAAQKQVRIPSTRSHESAPEDPRSQAYHADEVTSRDSFRIGPLFSSPTPKLSPRRRPFSHKLVASWSRTAATRPVPRSKSRQRSRPGARNTPPKAVRSGSPPFARRRTPPGCSAPATARGNILTTPSRRLRVRNRHRLLPSFLAPLVSPFLRSSIARPD